MAVWGGYPVEGVHQVEVCAAGAVDDEGECEGVCGGRGAVLDGDGELLPGASDIESAVNPGVEVSRPTEALAALRSGGAILPGVVHDEDGDIVLALELAEKREHGGDLRGAVLVDAMEADEGVEQE